MCVTCFKGGTGRSGIEISELIWKKNIIIFVYFCCCFFPFRGGGRAQPSSKGSASTAVAGFDDVEEVDDDEDEVDDVDDDDDDELAAVKRSHSAITASSDAVCFFNNFDTDASNESMNFLSAFITATGTTLHICKNWIQIFFQK